MNTVVATGDLAGGTAVVLIMYVKCTQKKLNLVQCLYEVCAIR